MQLSTRVTRCVEHAWVSAQRAKTTAVPFDPSNYRNIRCETFGGTQLDPADAVAAAIKGHVRRVVYTTPEASISQKGRFFTGGSGNS